MPKSALFAGCAIAMILASSTWSAEIAIPDLGARIHRLRTAGNGVGVDPDYRGKALHVQFTVEDPNVVTAPWSAASTYRKSAVRWEERVCAENPRVYDAPSDTPVPTSEKLDF